MVYIYLSLQRFFCLNVFAITNFYKHQSISCCIFQAVYTVIKNSFTNCSMQVHIHAVILNNSLFLYGPFTIFKCKFLLCGIFTLFIFQLLSLTTKASNPRLYILQSIQCSYLNI